MTAIPSWFTAQMARMADLRSAPSALHMWWEGLSGLPQPALEAAVTHAIQTRTWFPTPAELREDADVARPAQTWTPPAMKALPEPVLLGTLPTGQAIVGTQVWEPHCHTCADSGFAPQGDALTVVRCACWDTNPVLVQRRAAQASSAQQRMKGQ